MLSFFLSNLSFCNSEDFFLLYYTHSYAGEPPVTGHQHNWRQQRPKTPGRTSVLLNTSSVVIEGVSKPEENFKHCWFFLPGEKAALAQLRRLAEEAVFVAPSTQQLAYIGQFASMTTAGRRRLARAFID